MVLGLVHDTHAAATELFEDAVVRDSLADQFGLTNHWRECYEDAWRGVNCRCLSGRFRVENGCEERERTIPGTGSAATSPYHQKNERVRLREEEAL